MNQPKIDVFYYDEEIEKLPEEWMKDMAIVFRELDEDEDGKVDVTTAHHIMDLFRLPNKGCFKDMETVKMHPFLEEAQVARDEIFMNTTKRYRYYFQMIAGLGKNTIDAIDIQRFVKVSGDEIPLKFCDDFIDEFDRLHLSKDSLTQEEFCAFCAQKKVPV